MDDLLNIPMLGKLEIVETYAYYDQPVLFSCKNAAGHLYLVVAADENDRHETWLYVGVSEERLNLIRSGAIDLHDAFADPEDGYLVQAIVPYDSQTEIQFDSIPPDQISEDMLPIPGERLNLKTNTLPVLSSPEEIAKFRRQEILHLTLNFVGVFGTEAPATALSQILGTLQNVINTVGMARFNLNQVTKRIRHKNQISLIGIGAGSFDIRLASTENADLFSHSDFGDTIEKFLELLNAGSDQDELKRLLGQLKQRVAKNYAKFLISLSESVCDTKLTWTSPKPDRGGTASLSESQMRETIEILQRIQAEPSSTFTVTGTLIGASLKSKKFDIRTSKKTFTGTIAEQAIATVRTARLSQTYTAELQEIHERNETTGEVTKTKYQLISLGSPR